jgi:hypothetical protein
VLGIKDLAKFDMSFMRKWWWKLEKDNGPWQYFMKEQISERLSHL